MGKNRTIILTVISSIIGLLAISWGSTYSVPDLEEVKYGFPLIWGRHLLNTITGPVDKWYIDYNSMVIDLVFWFGVIILALSISLYKD